jgi:hypothetical protein
MGQVAHGFFRLAQRQVDGAKVQRGIEERRGRRRRCAGRRHVVHVLIHPHGARLAGAGNLQVYQRLIGMTVAQVA